VKVSLADTGRTASRRSGSWIPPIR